VQTFRTLLAAVAVAAFVLPATAADISGAGATSPYPIYAKWAEAYRLETGIGVAYRAIGSGAGITEVQAKAVIFGASDMPLTAADLEKSGLVQFPTVIGGVVPVMNVEGIKSGDVVLNGPTLARIFLGRIKTWNDPAIRKLNPSTRLPSQPIAIVRRADGSGTTFMFTDYLSKISTDWRTKVGASTAVEWPVGTGAPGNAGVADAVARSKGAIGYVEYAYAKQNRLTYAPMVNKDGKTIAPTAETFMAAAAGANWEASPGFGVVLTNQAGMRSWPIVGATFILMHKRPDDPAAAAQALKFFAWAFAKGGKMAEELDYVPMPATVVSTIRRMWATEIKDAAGQPILAAQ
jgi:phosphate transport system substrate-binding protein